MTNVPEYLANIRLMTNDMVVQLDNVHKLCCVNELDVETVMLNLKDLSDQLDDIKGELKDMRDELDTDLSSDSEDNL